MLTKYQPSGSFTGKFLAGTPLVLLGAAVLGAVYQVLLHFIPIIKLDIIIVVLMCVATVFLLQLLTKTAHCRNRTLGAGLGFAAGAVAVIVSHVVQYQMDRPGLIMTVPAAQRAAVDATFGFSDYLQFRAESGWTIGRVGSTSSPSSGADIYGAGVYACWAIEALVILGAATVGGIRAASEPYCEACQKWANYPMLTLEVPEPSPETTANVKGALTMAALLPSASAMTRPAPPIAPPPPEVPLDPAAAKKQAKALAKEAAKAAKAAKTVSCLRYSVKSCPVCKMIHTLKVEQEAITTAGGKSQRKATTLHNSIVLTSEEVGALAQLKR